MDPMGFMLLGADINLSGTVWSAADRTRKLILRGQCGMVRFHPVLSFEVIILLRSRGKKSDRPKKQQVTIEGF